MGIKIRKISILFLIFSLLIVGPICSKAESTTDEVKILCFIENGFGESYYINKGFLESYNYSIITASSSGYVYGCNNFDKNISDTYSDILVSSITDEDISLYDCILIPSGGHWGNIVGHSRILEILQIAHEEGILLAGICTGMIVLAYANILEGVNVAQNNHAINWLQNAGANITTESVVYDQGIITAGWGGGVGSGAENAPNEEFCEMIKEMIENSTKKVAITPIIVSMMLVTSFSLITITRKTKRIN